MPKKKLIRQSEFPYHVTTRNNHKDWFSIPIYDVWDYCKEAIVYSLERELVVINCFVLMSNHYHLLLSTPNSNIDKFMMHFNWRLSFLISRHSKVINHKFANRYKWSIVDNCEYLQNVYRYIYQNPVRAKLSLRCVDYPYSSIHFTRFESKQLKHSPHFQYMKFESYFEKHYGNEFDSIIRSSLSRKIFKPRLKIAKWYQNKLENLPN